MIYNAISFMSLCYSLQFCLREPLHDVLLHLINPSRIDYFRTLQLYREEVPIGELILQVLCRSETFKFSIHHDGQPRAERLTLLHAV